MTFKTELDQAARPLVLALDVGSTGTRGGVYDARGLPVSGHRHKLEHAFTTTAAGESTIDADQIVDEISAVIDACLDGVDEVEAVSIDTFSSSLIGVGADGRAVTPCITYADSRCAGEVSRLREERDEGANQQRTGTRFHTSYLPARLLWAQSQPFHADVRRWMSLSEYAWWRLLGTTAAGTAVAAWTGLLDRRTGQWDADLLDFVGVPEDALSPVHDPDQTLTAEPGSAATRWPALRTARWLPGIADGWAANLGAGALDPATAVVSAATSGAMRITVDAVPDHLPPGLWCYRLDRRRSLVGGALNDVGRAVSWMQETLALPDEAALDAALLADPEPTTPLVLPFFTGERATGWAQSARAVFTGVSAGQSATDLYRGVMEGVALSYARLAAQLRDVAGAPRQILAGGRVSTDAPGLLQLLADALDAPVTPVTIKRSTLHGTALLALEVADPDGDRAPALTGPTSEPTSARRDYYRERLAAFEELYGRVI